MLVKLAIKGTVDLFENRRRSSYASREEKAFPTYKVVYATPEELFAAFDTSAPTFSQEVRKVFLAEANYAFKKEEKILLDLLQKNQEAMALHEQSLIDAQAAREAVMAEPLAIWFSDENSDSFVHRQISGLEEARRQKADKAYRDTVKPAPSSTQALNLQAQLDALRAEYETLK